MILQTTLAIGMFAITGFANLNDTGTYTRQITCNSYNRVQSIVCGSTSGGQLEFVNSVGLNFVLKYNPADATIYEISNIKFNVTSSSYYYYASNGNRELDTSVTYGFNTTWVITNDSSTYDNQFEKTQFYFGVNEDDLTISHFYDGVLIESKSVTLDNEAVPSISRLELSLSSSNLFSEIEDFITSSNISYQNGYSDGYGDGLTDNIGMNPEMFTIFNGILNIATIPINVLLGIFNFEVFGINISSLVSALLSIAVLVIVIRLVVGSNAKGD